MKPRHRRNRIEPRLRSLLAVSLGIHLVLFYLLAAFHLTLAPLKEEPVYYVDITNLPVANPRQGAPTPGPAPAAPQEPAAQPEMRQPAPLPPKNIPKTAADTGKPAAKAAPDAGREFEERMKKMAGDAEARHAASAMDAIRKKSAAGGGKGPQGMPTGTGTETGSSYAAYIQSRLADAFRETIAYQSGTPETAVRLTIDGNGRLIGQKIERSSKDPLFDNAVRRAITKAEANFPPPPDGKRFDVGFVFRPQGVGVGKK